MAILNVREKRGGSSSTCNTKGSGDITLTNDKGHNKQQATGANGITIDGISQRPTSTSDPEGHTDRIHLDPFGSEEGAAIQYRTMEWWHCGLLMIAENISLGVLALPQAVAWLGIVPGLLLIFFLGILAGYTGYIIGQFKEAFPIVQSFGDCGDIICGRIGKWVLAVSQVLILVFIMAAHVVSFAIAMNVLTDHSMCTVAFALFGMIVQFVLGLPRALKGISYLSIFSCLSVITAVTVAMIGIGITKPDMGHILAVQPNMPLVKGLTPVMNIVLAYTGHVGFFGFFSELKNTRDFPKALAFMQILAITFYMLISAVIYYYAGPHVASPALGSASYTVRKVAFGIALPTIIVAGVVNGSVACKHIYILVWKGTNTIHQKSFKSLASWVGICGGMWLASWVIAESIPNFTSLLALIGAIFCSWFSYGIPAILWLYMNKGRYFSTRSKTALTILNLCIFLLGFALCVLGLYNSIHEFSTGATGNPFSCANNWQPSTELSSEL